ncbi:MAG TPA: RNA methyltransferase [Chloroflexia bacterium]|nr:RNA methyltransferase [Chloroflexia bacterium]
MRTRSERERTGTYYIEGARIVAQAVQAGAEITQGVIAPELIKGTPHSLDTVQALRSTGAPVAELSPSAFESISFKENLQGIGAVVRYHSDTLSDIPVEQGGLWVALDNVGNPGNLGAIMRTCDATGVAGLLLLGETTDPYHPTAIRASMGSFFALRMIRAGFDEFVQWSRVNGYTVVGTSPTAEKEYNRVSYPEKSVLLMGSERLGLSLQQQAACDLLVQIPMVGTADSLNLGVATSIMLYEIFNQHRGTSRA